MQAILNHVDHLTDDIYMFWFELEKPLDYIAGQFVQITLEHEEQDGRGSRRWFTISSSPTEELLAVTVRLQNNRQSSFKQALKNLQPGDALDISDPMGDFVLPIDKDIPLTFIAGGIGITPMRSMVKYLLDKNESRDITIHYLVPTTENAVFSEIFKKYHAELHISTTEYAESKNALNYSEITSTAASEQNRLFYVSGPEKMVEVIVAQLGKHGIASHQIVTDYFHGYTTL